MKKVLLFVAVVTAASFASCKKDHTCTCTTTYSGSTITTTDITTFPSSTKKAASANCLSSTSTLGTSTRTQKCDLN